GFLAEPAGPEPEASIGSEDSEFDLRSGSDDEQGLVLIEVDGLIAAGRKSSIPNFRERLMSRFHFGKWKETGADYGGRHFRQHADRISVDQEKYIREQLSCLHLDKSRRESPEEPLSPSEVSSYRAATAQVQWVARESRPDVAGGASMLASAMPNPTVADGLMLIKICRYLKATAAQRLTIWALDPHSLAFATASDAGGPGGARRGGAQGAWLVLVADAGIRKNVRAKVSLLSWHSQRLKRVVASTVAAETLSLSSAVSEAQWLQVLWRDAVYGDVPRPDWHAVASPFAVVMSQECSLGEKASALSVVDAKSVFDTLSRNTAGSRADRRNSVELAVVRDSLSAVGSPIRWLPHGRMPADPLTHADPAKGNLAFHDLLCRGTLCLVDESGHINERSLNTALKSRSRGASRRALTVEAQRRDEGSEWGSSPGLETKEEEEEEDSGGGGDEVARKRGGGESTRRSGGRAAAPKQRSQHSDPPEDEEKEEKKKEEGGIAGEPVFLQFDQAGGVAVTFRG
ncbi:unnamed protein product, partial [Prorocentrum cordatum]